MKSLIPASLAVTVSALLTACGGGGDGSIATSSSNFTVSGTVPGTLIEAFCDDGSYYATHSDNDGSTQHPFSLDLPTGINCRLVMSTNEDDLDNKVVTPIRIVTSSGQSSIAFNSEGESVDLGYVALAMSRNTMLSDQNGDGVEDLPLDVAIATTSASSFKVAALANDPLDRDGDGIINTYEDDDGDRRPNRDDDDDDNDGLPDYMDNDQDNDGRNDDDLDGDGVSNDRDTDDDNDGVPDSRDDDDDNDGESDSSDRDDDNDGIDDSDEGRDSDRDDDNDDDSNSNSSGGTINIGTGGSAITPAPGEPSAGRLLAAQCAQCHGTDGRSVSDIDSLAGESASEIIEEMRELQREGGIMGFHANGYSDAEIQAIGAYFATVPGGSRND